MPYYQARATGQCGKKMQNTSLKPITQLVRPVVKKILPQKSALFQQLFDVWPDLVHGTDAAGTIPEKLSFAGKEQANAVLSLWARTAGQATELTYNRAALVQRINMLFGYALVKDIRVTAHPLQGLPPRRGANPAKVNAAKGMPSQSLDKILAGISNPVLRQHLMELGGVIEAQPVDIDKNKGENHA